MKAERASINTAYEFVQPSYALLVGRLDAADARLQSIQNFAATMTFAAPVLAKAVFGDVLEFSSMWFYGALGVFAGILGVGIWVRIKGGHLKLIDPGVLYRKWLGFKTESEFKGLMLGFAGNDFAANKSLVNRRGDFVAASTVLFGVEVVLLLLWIVGVGGV